MDHTDVLVAWQIPDVYFMGFLDVASLAKLAVDQRSHVLLSDQPEGCHCEHGSSLGRTELDQNSSRVLDLLH